MLASSCKVPTVVGEDLHLGLPNTASIPNPSSQHLPANLTTYTTPIKTTRHGRKPPPRSPDLIELSDTGPSPVSGIEDDSSPPVTDVDSEDPRGDTESPTPTNSAANISHSRYWQGEEHRELLATEGEEEEEEEEDETSEDRDRGANDEELLNIKGSSSSELPTSAEQSEVEENTKESAEGDDLDDEEIWHIQPEQLTYYVGQFRTLQSDPRALVGGTQAKQFFEKSRLPTAELSKIWQLSDVTRDGALSLAEFCTAMHLVVLRRNGIPLPSHLPPVLDPANLSVSLYVHQPAPQKTQHAEESQPATQSVGPPRAAKQLPTAEDGVQPAAALTHEGSQWTKFIDSPTSSLASPGPRPVNFDFHRSQVEQDPRILHPVAVRVTPDSQQQTHGEGTVSAAGPSSLPTHATVSTTSSMPASSSTGIGGKKEPPPPPPPRPNRGHARSSSLDLNQLGNRNGNGGSAYPFAPPPAVPPRISPNVGSPRKETETAGSSGAFQVYRRPAPAQAKAASSQGMENRPAVSGKSLLSVISAHEQRNQVLRQQQLLLAKQLAELQEDRVGLELRMDKLKLQAK